MITRRSKREIWLGKGKIVEELFPREKPVPEYKQNKKEALVALRQIIEPQIISYRKSVLRQLQGPMGHKIKCAMSNQVINAGEFHIDHKYPFKNIVAHSNSVVITKVCAHNQAPRLLRASGSF